MGFSLDLAFSGGQQLLQLRNGWDIKARRYKNIGSLQALCVDRLDFSGVFGIGGSSVLVACEYKACAFERASVVGSQWEEILGGVRGEDDEMRAVYP